MNTRRPYVVDPVPWQPGLEGTYPGQECAAQIAPEQSMIFCWCPPTPPEQPFLMGSPLNEPNRADDETLHPAVLTLGFWLAKHPVSQAQWQAVMGRNPSQKGSGPSHPVDSVSWHQAQAFCEKVELQLPTEAQWEYACRAGSKAPFGVSDGQAINAQHANFAGSHPYGTGSQAFPWIYRTRTLPAGSFPPNAWGLHDMHGQLWEWCADWYASLTSSPSVNPVGPKNGSYRVLRGGSWFYRGRYARSACRNYDSPVLEGDFIGFRPCRSSTKRQGGAP